MNPVNSRNDFKSWWQHYKHYPVYYYYYYINKEAFLWNLMQYYTHLYHLHPTPRSSSDRAKLRSHESFKNYIKHNHFMQMFYQPKQYTSI